MVLKIILTFKNKIQKGSSRASDKDSLCYCCRCDKTKSPIPTLDFYFLHNSKSKRMSLWLTAAGLYKTPIAHFAALPHQCGFSLPKVPGSSWGRKLGSLGLSQLFLLLALKHFLCLHPQENNDSKDLTRCCSGLRGFYTGVTALVLSSNHKSQTHPGFSREKWQLWTS